MKPFNLEEAKAGKKVVTRDGRNARIISFDKVCDDYPIIALIDKSTAECTVSYAIDGSYHRLGSEHHLDLFMADDELKQETSDLQKLHKKILALANGEDGELLVCGVWVEKDVTNFAGKFKHRIKPKVKTVNGFEVPMHETIKLNHAKEYFTPSLAASNMWTSKRWGGYQTDKNLMDRGMVYLDKESAVKCAKAMLGINPEGDE